MLDEERTRRDVPPSLSLDDLLDDTVLSRAGRPGDDSGIRQALGACLARGTLVAARVGGEVRIWINDEPCRSHFEKAQLSALEPGAVAGGEFGERRSIADGGGIPASPGRANIFALYERHIGTFGHGMAEQLRAAEEEYPASWVEEAFEIAVEQGARSWSYVNAILTAWKQQGKVQPENTAKAMTMESLGTILHVESPQRQTGRATDGTTRATTVGVRRHSRRNRRLKAARCAAGPVG